MVSPRYLIRRQSAIMESTDLSISEEREETNMNITTVGLDLAKSVLHVACFNEHFKEVKKRMLRRNQVLQFFTQLHLARAKPTRRNTTAAKWAWI